MNCTVPLREPTNMVHMSSISAINKKLPCDNLQKRGMIACESVGNNKKQRKRKRRRSNK